jgi:[histone H3]-lysine4/36 N-trimethyltransferase SMYD
MSNEEDPLDAHLSAQFLKLVPDAIKHRILTTTCPVSRGTVVLRDWPIATCSTSLYVCHTCLHTSISTNSSSKRLLQCAQCKVTRYCSTVCQQKDWKRGHRFTCQIWRKRPNDDLGEVDLLVKILVALQAPPSSLEVKASHTSFAKLLSHLNEFDAESLLNVYTNTSLVANIHGLRSTSNTFSGESSGVPQIDTLMTYLAIIKSNNYAIYDADLNVLGEGCFPCGALLNHSCCANVSITFEAFGEMVVRAVRDLKVGDEILASYQDPMTPRTRRRQLLKKKYQ